MLTLHFNPPRRIKLKISSPNFCSDCDTIKTPEKIPDSFPIAAHAAQAGNGTRHSNMAHDKLGELADAGLIDPIEVSGGFASKSFPKGWQAVLHSEWILGISHLSRNGNPDL
jgi:maltose-binding protein MalE